ncbi:MAG: glycosyltransferase family 2 protein [Burkholderiaceae bacterium]|nr:MAG: glycosyltransferase family 2 protein [Burkholderiaceae bacterium]
MHSAPEALDHQPSLTIAVLTLNSATHIRACLESAAFADQVLVVDSGSTDDTLKIAEAMDAEVHVHADWQGFAEQRNRLLKHAAGDYIFFLDSDEIIGPKLRQEIQTIVSSGADGVWKIRWRIVAFGRELTYFRSNSEVERLFVRRTVRCFTGVVHEQAELTAALPRHVMRARLLHHSRETVAASLQKMTQYAMLGAAKRAEHCQRGGVLRGLASGGWMFFRLYFLHRGFLSGGAGFLYCAFFSLEAFFRYAALGYDKDLKGDVRRK